MTASAASLERALCPHCVLDLGEREQRMLATTAVRCPNCRLVIGRGRALLTTDAGGARSSGTAAGLIASAARREACAPGDRTAVTAALRAVALELGCDVRRLRMLDYERAYDHDRALPSLGVVLGTFGSWKDARRAAGA